MHKKEFPLLLKVAIGVIGAACLVLLSPALLLPPHDPQFRRNRERVVRDAEREHLILDWDLGLPEDEDTE